MSFAESRLSIDASTEREDLLDDKQGHADEDVIRELRASYRSLKRTFIIVVLLLGCIIVVVALPWHRELAASTWSRSPVPEIPMTRVIFQQQEKFATFSSEADDAWAEFMPPGDGFIVVEDPHSYDLPPGKDTKYGQVYDTSMWHQMHCLSHIRTYLSTMQSSLNETNILQLFEVALKPQQDHVLHCFDYLRQALMCAGDLTLEWPRTEADGRRFAVDGWGIEHQCRSWDTMADYVEKNAVGQQRRNEFL